MGHAVVAMFVALLVGLLLNSQGILGTAQSLPYGSTSRSVSIAFMRPINDVTGAIGLHEPRAGLQWALGRQSQGNANAFDVPSLGQTSAGGTTTTPSTTPGTTGGGTTGGGSSTNGGNTSPSTSNPPATQASQQKPTASNPLRILVLGDSLAGDFGAPLYEEAEKTGVIKPVSGSVVDYHISTGLTHPEQFDWPGELQSALQRYHPTTVVLALGLNDTQPMTAPDGSFLSTGSAGWLKEYQRRVGVMINLVLQTGAKIVYVAPPPTSVASNDAYLFPINVQIVKEAAKFPGKAASVFTYPKFADHGAYTQSLPINGKETIVRTADGIHVNHAGASIIVANVMKELGTLYQLPPSSTS